MNPWSLLREHVFQIVKALPWPAGVKVYKLHEPDDIWAIEANRAVGVSRTATRWLEGVDIGYSGTPELASMQFEITIKTDSPATTTSGLEETNQAEDLALIALGVRGVDIGAPDVDRTVLYAVAERVMVGPGRKSGGAGPIAIVLTFNAIETPI